MTATNYDKCLRQVLKFEGGYVDHPRDPGGATKMGITRATLAKRRGHPVSKQDVRDLTVTQAGEIYRPGYWDTVSGDWLPNGLDLVAFDGAVNSGPSRGAKWLQNGLGVKADGKIGPQSLKAARTAPDLVAVIGRACKARMGFLRRLGTWDAFGRGWSSRVAQVEAAAIAMEAPHALPKVALSADRIKSNQNTAATTTGGGGAIGGLSDLPDLAVYGIVAMAVVLAITLALKAAHNGRRATEFRNAAKEITA